MLGLDHLVDQRSGGGEAHPPFLLAGGDGQAGEQMGLAGAAVTDKDDRLRFGDVIALGKFMDLLGGDLGIAREVELRQGLHPRKTGFADAPFDQSLFALLEFGLEQRFQITEMGVAFAHRLFGQLGALGPRWPACAYLALLADGGGFKNGGLGTHGATSWLSSSS